MTATVGVSLTPLTVTWMFNGHAIQNPNVSNVTVPIVGTTVSTLTVPNCSPAEAGKYSVYVQNSGGSVTSADGLLVVLNLAILNNGTGLGNGGFHLNVVKPANSNCVVEATTDFSHWTPIYTNNSGSTNINYVDSAATNMPLRYYRLRLQ